MKFLLILISATSVFSLSKKMCINCKHFIKPDTPKQIGKCSLFPILNDMDSDTENEIDDKHFLDCNSSRKNYYMCGEKGRYYEKVVPVEYPPFLSLVDAKFFDEISEFEFEKYLHFL